MNYVIAHQIEINKHEIFEENSEIVQIAEMIKRYVNQCPGLSDACEKEPVM